MAQKDKLEIESGMELAYYQGKKDAKLSIRASVSGTNSLLPALLLAPASWNGRTEI